MEEKLQSAISSHYTFPVSLRLLLALLIGLPTTMMFPFRGFETPLWWHLGTPVTVLAIALIWTLMRDPLVTVGYLEADKVRRAAIILLALILLYVVVELLFWNINVLTSYLALPLIPLMVGLVASFTLGGGRRRLFSLLCGLCAWLGAAMGNIAATIYDALHMQPGTPLADALDLQSPDNLIVAVLVVSFMWHFIALAVAILGGDLGWLLRRKLLSERAVTIVYPANR